MWAGVGNQKRRRIRQKAATGTFDIAVNKILHYRHSSVEGGQQGIVPTYHIVKTDSARPVLNREWRDTYKLAKTVSTARVNLF